MHKYTVMESCNEDIPGWLIYKDDEVDHYFGPFYTRADAIKEVIALHSYDVKLDEA
jgi:hypothetical protein